MLKNILSGIGSVLVLCPAQGYSHYRGQGSELARTDYEALQEDVQAIGRDFYKAAEQGRKLVDEAKERGPQQA
ncbi:hypothetical protein NJH83_00085 [Pseudomonas chlororaphis]|uniref:hypothetical protein n=1 Tax=Pseudomonas chlororaphis TaxID=587753 RepID=UPI00209AD57A|nr:hypothetical protein [Pseudomonas chlororaphis]MCO7608621.1 hypothetical protein [Pseudomonas chlororaphis]